MKTYQIQTPRQAFSKDLNGQRDYIILPIRSLSGACIGFIGTMISVVSAQRINYLHPYIKKFQILEGS